GEAEEVALPCRDGKCAAGVRLCARFLPAIENGDPGQWHSILIDDAPAYGDLSSHCVIFYCRTLFFDQDIVAYDTKFDRQAFETFLQRFLQGGIFDVDGDC